MSFATDFTEPPISRALSAILFALKRSDSSSSSRSTSMIALFGIPMTPPTTFAWKCVTLMSMFRTHHGIGTSELPNWNRTFGGGKFSFPTKLAARSSRPVPGDRSWSQ